MAPPSAWGMTGAQDSSDAPAVHIGPGQEMCTLCMNAAVSIYLLPCKHQTCSNCVNSLRRSAVGQVSVARAAISAFQAHSRRTLSLCRPPQESGAHGAGRSLAATSP